MSATNKKYGIKTQMIHGGHQRTSFGETSEAIYLTSGFVYDRAEQAQDRFLDKESGFMYSRYGNPTVALLEERMAHLEGAEAGCATSSGMAAVYAAMTCKIRSGMRVVAAKLLFGSCRHIIGELFPRFGVEVEFVDGHDLHQWQTALAKPTDFVFFETPGNPTLSLIDIATVSALAHKAGALVVVDNVFATPILQKPMDLGADIVIYSTTKHTDGQGRCLGGMILSSRSYKEEYLHPFIKHTGPSMSPFNAWVMLKGLETLDLRVHQHCENAHEVALFLEAHPQVETTLYPGLPSFPDYTLAQQQMKKGGSLVAFRIKGQQEDVFQVMNRLELIVISNNLGDTKSLITHPTTTTHSKLSQEERLDQGITDNLVRLSIGLEEPQDIINDLDKALSSLQNAV